MLQPPQFAIISVAIATGKTALGEVKCLNKYTAKLPGFRTDGKADLAD